MRGMYPMQKKFSTGLTLDSREFYTFSTGILSSLWITNICSCISL